MQFKVFISWHYHFSFCSRELWYSMTRCNATLYVMVCRNSRGGMTESDHSDQVILNSILRQNGIQYHITRQFSMNFRLLCFVAGSEGVKLVVQLDFEDPIKLRSEIYRLIKLVCCLLTSFLYFFFIYCYYNVSKQRRKQACTYYFWQNMFQLFWSLGSLF